MSIGQLCSRVVATATPEETIAAGAARMAEFGVGSLVAVNGDGKPEGILTDRDVALRVVGEGLIPSGTLLSQVMSRPVRTLDEATPLEEALGTMEKASIRRIVVTGGEGTLVGIFTLDDALELISREVTSIGRVMEKQGQSVMSGS